MLDSSDEESIFTGIGREISTEVWYVCIGMKILAQIVEWLLANRSLGTPGAHLSVEVFPRLKSRNYAEVVWQWIVDVSFLVVVSAARAGFDWKSAADQ